MNTDAAIALLGLVVVGLIGTGLARDEKLYDPRVERGIAIAVVLFIVGSVYFVVTHVR